MSVATLLSRDELIQFGSKLEKVDGFPDVSCFISQFNENTVDCLWGLHPIYGSPFFIKDQKMFATAFNAGFDFYVYSSL